MVIRCQSRNMFTIFCIISIHLRHSKYYYCLVLIRSDRDGNAMMISDIKSFLR